MSDPTAASDLTMSHGIFHRVVLRNAVHRAACSPVHAELLLNVQQALDPSARIDDEAVTPHNSCAHCGWCGRIVAVPKRQCRVHDVCPSFDAMASDVVDGTVQMLRMNHNVQVFPPRFWAQLLEMADLHQGGPEFRADRFAREMWARRVDWMHEH